MRKDNRSQGPGKARENKGRGKNTRGRAGFRQDPGSSDPALEELAQLGQGLGSCQLTPAEHGLVPGLHFVIISFFIYCFAFKNEKKSLI